MIEPMAPPTMFDVKRGYWTTADWSMTVGDRMRGEKSVHLVTMPDGVPVWVVTRYEDAHKLLSCADGTLSKDAAGLARIMSRYGLDPADLSGMFFPHMMFRDPPDHTRLRKLVTGKFTGERVAALRPRVAELADDLLSGLPADGQVDLIADLAFPLPLIVICELLGVPTDPAVRDNLRDWTAALMENEQEGVKGASAGMVAFFTELIERKMREPGDDLLSALLEIEGDGLLRSSEVGRVRW